jgi:hypothetical protein
LQPIPIKQENAMSRFPKIATSRSLVSLGAIAAVMVLSTMSSAWAADTPAASQTPQQTATPKREAPTGTHIASQPTDLAPIEVNGFHGAVHAPGDAQWTDNDSSVPKLPIARE